MVRKACAAACALFVLGAVGLGGCSTDAVGIEACRLIQTARCEVAPSCLGQEGFAIETEEQVTNCVTYYIDGCLVGVENPDESPDGDGTGEECAAAMRALGACQAEGKTLVTECAEVVLNDGEDAATSTCRALKTPHVLTACKWIEEVEDDD